MSHATPNHLPLEALLDYWLHDSDAAATDAVDEHLMQCDACGAALDELVALGDGVRDAFRAGAVATMVSGTFASEVSAFFDSVTAQSALPKCRCGRFRLTRGLSASLMMAARPPVGQSKARPLSASAETASTPGGITEGVSAAVAASDIGGSLSALPSAVQTARTQVCAI
jgi:hypothetical protein